METPPQRQDSTSWWKRWRFLDRFGWLWLVYTKLDDVLGIPDFPSKVTARVVELSGLGAVVPPGVFQAASWIVIVGLPVLWFISYVPDLFTAWERLRGIKAPARTPSPPLSIQSDSSAAGARQRTQDPPDELIYDGMLWLDEGDSDLYDGKALPVGPLCPDDRTALIYEMPDRYVGRERRPIDDRDSLTPVDGSPFLCLACERRYPDADASIERKTVSTARREAGLLFDARRRRRLAQ